VFATLKARRYEPAGKPVTRIANQLGNLDDVIWKELGLGVATPEGVWDWLGRKKEESWKVWAESRQIVRCLATLWEQI